MTLHRFFLPPEAFQTDTVLFSADQAHQIRSVLRLRVGDRVLALDGAGGEAVVRLVSVGRQIEGMVEERGRNAAEPRTSLTLYQGLLKGARLELVLQKGTEIGVTGFVPVQTQRSVPSEPNPARQRRFAAIVREAAEQSRRGRLPEVSPALSFPAALARASTGGLTVLLWEDEQSLHLSNLSIVPDETAVSLFVGPEGGFTADEAAQARRSGAHVVTLGPRILRAETAALVGAALLLARRGDLG